ncbi:sulfite exporter TauE/SafE family protein [soil metagenome]
MDIALVIAGFFIGGVVGLTGMGGGALMTPVLVLFFGIPPLAAVSSDLVVSAIMKPVGGLVHLRRGTVDLSLVKWLCIGSVPFAFSGVLVSRWLGDSGDVQQITKIALGVALLIAAAGLIHRAYLGMVKHAQRRAGGFTGELPEATPIQVRPVPTMIVGAIGGLIVGMTSVGSGSLIIIALLTLYPALSPGRLVGTDLVQAVPLVVSAAIGHLLFGDFQLDLTTSLLVGCLPGVYLGARLSAYAPGGIVRRALALVLLASGLKLVGADNTTMVVVIGLVLLIGPLLWMLARRRHGLPARSKFLTRHRSQVDAPPDHQHGGAVRGSDGIGSEPPPAPR